MVNPGGSVAISNRTPPGSLKYTEWKYCRSIERYAREQPEDPDVPQMLERVRRWRDAYLRWGRETLGFAVYLFYRPGPTLG